jgi:hypothetical protein
MSHIIIALVIKKTKIVTQRKETHHSGADCLTMIRHSGMCGLNLPPVKQDQAGNCNRNTPIRYTFKNKESIT